MILLVAVLVLFIFIGFIFSGLKRINKKAHLIETITGTGYVVSIALFAIGMMIHNSPYYNAIDPVDGDCYSPFSDQHLITLLVYFLAFNGSLLLVWTKGKNLPPLTLTLSLIFISIGVIISFTILLQISAHDTSTIDIYGHSNHETLLFLCTPLLSVAIGILLIIRVMNHEISASLERTYANKYVNTLNSFLATRSRSPLWIVLLMFPIFILITLILIVFGQDANSIVKVFTDTTTWRFSQQLHPPILDHQGHYLCTVAASGHPKIVKPLRMGQRNGRPIIVNRQLLIANAFEELVQDFSPRLHRIIRKNYDTYGYNISRQINTTFLSNMTYIVMKPLEWLFLIFLYLFCRQPEKKIKRQYAA